MCLACLQETANMATPTCITNTKARPTSSSCSVFPPSLIPSYSCTSNIMKDCKAESADIMMTIMFEYIQYLTHAEDSEYYNLIHKCTGGLVTADICLCHHSMIVLCYIADKVDIMAVTEAYELFLQVSSD